MINDMNLTAILYKTVKKFPKKFALIQGNEYVTFNDLWEKIERLGDAFQEVGLKEGDKVAIILPNCKEFIFCLFAIFKNNLILLPLKPELTSHELKYILEDSRPDAVITISDYLSRLESLIKSIKNIFIIDNYLKNKSDYKNYFTFRELYEIGASCHSNIKNTKSSLIASINYTYNGKGIPLGAMLAHRNYIHAAIGYIKLLEVTSEIKLLLLLPMYHVFGLMGGVIVPLLVGGAVVIAETLKPTKIFKDIEFFRINFILGTPAMYMLLLEYYDRQKHDLGSLKYCISGGSYMSSELYREIKSKMGIEVLQGYGLTECFPIICNTKRRNIPGTLGVTGHRVRVKIDKKHSGDVGELVVSSPTTMIGYYNQPEITKEVLKDGWLHTGDYAEIDIRTGHIIFEGTKKNIIKINGNTVDLAEVYNVLSSHPEILNVKLYKKDTVSGCILTAEVLVKTTSLTEIELKKFCMQCLANYKIPKAIKVKEATHILYGTI